MCVRRSMQHKAETYCAIEVSELALWLVLIYDNAIACVHPSSLRSDMGVTVVLHWEPDMS